MAQLQLAKGKAEYVKRTKPNGELEDICLCGYNADFSAECIEQVHGSLLSEVIKNNGSYDQDKIDGYRKNIGLDFRCIYCYAKRKNWGKITLKIIGNKTRLQFEKEKPKIIRLGKNTECGHFFYTPQLIKFLELCKEYETQVIFPNKALKFDEKIAALLRGTNSVLNYSLGNDRFERGAVSQGFTNSWRAEQARMYGNAGVNATITLTCDVTSSLKENIARGFAIEEALNAQRQGITLRLLPLRLTSKKVCLEATGKKWGEIVIPTKDGDILDFGIEWRYLKKGNNEAVPLFFHEDFQKMVDEGIGVCGRVGEIEYCDECNLTKDIRISFPASELTQVKRYITKRTYKRYKGKINPQKSDDNPLQRELF
jgi:hypothetical protein